ncbi:MAG: hypothetical protein KC418_16725 [Anaerolineales bacterium]|nr:hypothetical protein [Anaerolineales bacterium]
MSAISLPRLTLLVNDRPLSGERGSPLTALTAVRVQQRLSLPTLCELTFSDPPGPLTIGEQLSPGARLRLLVETEATPLFVGQITAIEYVYLPSGGRELRVRGYDALHILRKQHAVRAHVQVNARELAAELAAPAGLRVEAEAAGPMFPRIVQHRQSNFDLLAQVMARCGFYFVVRDEVLHLLTLDGLGAAQSLTLGASLLEAQISLNGDQAARSVSTMGWSPLPMETFSGQATAARSGRDVASQVAPAAVNGDGAPQLVDENTVDSEHADALAQAELDRRTAAEVTLWGVARGNPALQPGTPIAVSGVDEALTGHYVLTRVDHVVDARLGFVSEIATAPPPPPPRPHSAIAALGVVTSVADPDGFGRVRVAFPTYNNVESEWLQVVSPAAGVHKGLVALPDVDDNVLVLFTHQDPAQGVVVGGIYGPFAPYDSGVEGDDVKRYSLRTVGGHIIRLDDQAKTLRVEDSSGSFVEMAPGKVKLYATADLEISAPGKSIVIESKAIDFRQR